MLGFHIDMNMAHHRADYLGTWLRELARLGYDTILWEIESSVVWETCPECVAPEAFSKNEMRALLAECSLYGLEPIPLLQTIGHAEYVLKHDRYAHLRELPDSISQYCPRNSKTIPFLHAWIDEYLDLFGPVKRFHVGADESMNLGACPSCRSYADEHSLSKLYVDHVNAVVKPLLRRGITPVIWADMVLGCNEALDQLSHDILLFDWQYDIHRGRREVCIWSRALKPQGKVFTFGNPMTAPADMTEAEKQLFTKFIFPSGDEGSEPEVFYTADYLAAKGFAVVTCPASSHYGDNVFSPRDRLHAANVYDSTHKGMETNLCGSMLTSWSVHLHPWELQSAYISLPAYIKSHPQGSIDDFHEWYARERFGAVLPEFWRACELLSGGCLFSHTSSLGFGKACMPVASGLVSETLRRLRDENRISAERQQCARREMEYSEALAIVRSLERQIVRGQELLRIWKLAARNLASRAEVALFLLDHADEVIREADVAPSTAQRARIVLGRMRGLRKEIDQHYATIIRPARREVMVGYMFGALERELARLADALPPRAARPDASSADSQPAG